MFQPRTIIEQSRVIVVNPLPLPAITESPCGVLLLGALLLAGCAKEASPPVNVLLVVVDTLRQDHLGAYGYRAHPATPQLDRFAREDAVTLDGMIGVSSWTMPSMATLFTGQFPAEHGVMRMMGEHSKLSEPHTLAARFGAGGWETGAVQSNFLLQQRRMSGFNRGFQYWDDSPTEQPDPHRGSSAADVANRGLKWLSERDGEHPWFMYLHFFDPHASYEDHAATSFTDPEYRGWVEGGLANDILRQQGPLSNSADRAQLAAFYDEEVAAVDAAFGQIIAALKERPDWENTLVVFTSDHGEELGERGYIGHTRTLHFEQTDLPLLVRLPAGVNAGTKASHLCSQVDLAGTILELAGLPRTDLSSIAAVLTGDRVEDGIIQLGDPAATRIQSEVDFVPVRSEHAEKRVRKRALVSVAGRYIVDLESGEESLYYYGDDASELRDRSDDEEFSAMLQDFRDEMKKVKWWSGE